MTELVKSGYVLVRVLGPTEMVLQGGPYAVIPVEGNVLGDVVGEIDEARFEIIEISRDGSAAEWGRLVGIKEDLVKVAKVMDV